MGENHAVSGLGRNELRREIPTLLSVGEISRIFGVRNCAAGLTDADTAEINVQGPDHGDPGPAQLPPAINTLAPAVQTTVHAHRSLALSGDIIAAWTFGNSSTALATRRLFA